MSPPSVTPTPSTPAFARLLASPSISPPGTNAWVGSSKGTLMGRLHAGQVALRPENSSLTRSFKAQCTHEKSIMTAPLKKGRTETRGHYRTGNVKIKKRQRGVAPLP